LIVFAAIVLFFHHWLLGSCIAVQDKAENGLLGKSIPRTLNLGLMGGAVGHLLVFGPILNQVRLVLCAFCGYRPSSEKAYDLVAPRYGCSWYQTCAARPLVTKCWAASAHLYMCHCALG
jgi:hypothetical protein